MIDKFSLISHLWSRNLLIISTGHIPSIYTTHWRIPGRCSSYYRIYEVFRESCVLYIRQIIILQGCLGQHICTCTGLNLRALWRQVQFSSYCNIYSQGEWQFICWAQFTSSQLFNFLCYAPLTLQPLVKILLFFLLLLPLGSVEKKTSHEGKNVKIALSWQRWVYLIPV